MTMLAHALAYAAEGIPIFPCRRDKAPLVKRGFQVATSKSEQVKSWWERWPDALIGMPTGTASGVDVLDIDNKNGKNGFASVANWADLSPLIVRTPTGGAHLYFKSSGSMRNSASKLAPGLDVRGEGGYVILPPSVTDFGQYTYEKGDLSTRQALPSWPVLNSKNGAGQNATPLLHEESGIDFFCSEMSAASEGTRNDTLNRLAFKAGQLVAREKINETEAKARLIDAALSTGLSQNETDATVNAAIDAGKQSVEKGIPEHILSEIKRLAGLTNVQYELERKDAAIKLGIRAVVLDEQVRNFRQTDPTDELQGSPLSLPTIEPWPEPVDGESLLSEMETVIRRYVCLTDGQALAVALWIIHTHAIDAAEHYPRLHIASPAPRCGKTTLLRVIEPMVPKALHTENITISALFRVVEKIMPTLMIDEVDAFLRDKDELRGLLNAGHSRDGRVVRTVGDDFEPRSFKVSCPVVLAGIGRIPATLEDRSITISLRRRLAHEKIERLRRAHALSLAAIGRRVARWVEDHFSGLMDADPDLPDALNDRAQDNWRPLIAIADKISPDTAKRARQAAEGLVENDGDEDNASIMMLADVAQIFLTRKAERLSSQDLENGLKNMEDRPWADWRRGSGITKAEIARLLRPFGIRPKQIRFQPKPAGTVKGYERAFVLEVAARYVHGDFSASADADAAM